MLSHSRFLTGRLLSGARTASLRVGRKNFPTTPNHPAVRAFSAAPSLMDLIKDLRATSGAPIVDCKKALKETDNDLKKALDWLREHGAAKVASKVGDRDAKEGLVGLAVSDDRSSAALVQVTSETDFAGRSETFVDLVTTCAEAALQSSKEANGELKVEDLMKATHDNKTVEESLNEAIVSIRENLSLANATSIAAQEGGAVVGYVHGRVLPSYAGTAAALVDLAPDGKDTDQEALLEIGKKLAMHIVAAKPQYQSVDDVPTEVVDAERELLSKQIADSGKPPHIVEKIVEGRLRKFYEACCLLEQSHMIEADNPKIGTYLKSQGIRLNRFYLVSIA